MSSDGSVFTSDNLDEYLKEIAKEYRKMGGKFMPAEDGFTVDITKVCKH